MLKKLPLIIAGLLIFWLFCPLKAQRGKDGARIVNAPNIIFNEFSAITADAAAGALTVTVNNSQLNNNGRFPANLAPGDLVMIIQMQGATIKGNVANNTWGEVLAYNNCGHYEFKEVFSVPNSTTIQFTCPLLNSYTASGRSQVVRMPRLISLTVNNGGVLTTDAWNGQVGGVLAAEVLNATVVNAGGSVDATGKGFRGGDIESSTSFAITSYASASANDGAEKGESIAGFKNDYNAYGGRYGRGAPANGGGGGNAHNAGGGGGANAGVLAGWNGDGNPDNTNPNWTTAWNLEAAGFANNVSSGGGRGGYTYSANNANAITQAPGNAAWGGDNRQNVGGKGGRPLDYTTGRIFLGGGGGAGDGNNNANQPGNSGGGIIYMLSYGNISGAGSIISNGNSSSNTVSRGNDAPGGGGGGGTIMLSAVGAITGVSAIANGGTGGSQIITWNEAEGPGGGGGGGYIATTNATINQQANGENNGTSNSPGVTEFIPNGATRGANGVINQIVIAPIVLTTINDTICANQTGTVSANVSGPVPPGAVINWYSSPTGGTPVATGPSWTTPALTSTTIYWAQVCPANYRVPDTVFVNPLPVPVASQTHASCKFLQNGTGTITPSLGTPPYTYSWSTSPVQSGATATGLSAGTYSVTVRDSKGCTSTQTVTITEPPIVVATITGNNPVACNGQSSGTLSTGVNGGTPPYTYSWSPTGGTAPTVSGLPAGNYIVTVTDSKGCQALANQTITEPPALTASTTYSNVVCSGGSTGSALVTTNGGTAPYTYLWNPGGQTGATATGLAAGTYSVTVTDSRGCLVIRSVTIAQPTMILSAGPSHVSCSGGSNGMAVSNVSGGTPAYTYSWSNGAATSIASNLTAGTYTLTVRDANNCPTTTTVTITQPAVLNTQSAPAPVSCFGDKNGSITVSATGGTSPYSYLWLHNGNTGSTITGLSAGTYSYTVTDSKGCSTTATAAVTQPPGMTLSASFQNATCGFTNGQVSVTPSGGLTPYTYSWQPGGANTPVVTGLSAGSYSVVVTQPNGCTQGVGVMINNLTGPVLTINGKTPASCYGMSNGTLTVSAAGGTAPYTYQWSPAGGTNAVATGLAGGRYDVTVTDANGCIRVISDSITQPSQLNANATKTDLTCRLANNGIASVTVFGGTPGYTYLWSPGGAATAIATGLQASTYSVTVSDANGCTTQQSVTITQPQTLLVASVTSTPVNCTGNNGTATVTASGGTTPYQYSWTPAGGSSSTAVGLTAGAYTVTVLDNRGCQATNTTTISQLTPLSANAISTQVSCFGGSNGTANVTASGGQPPYTYNWSPAGGTGTAATGLSAGTHHVTVQDSAGCQYIAAVTVIQPGLLTASTNTISSVCTQANGRASVSVTGGTGPYTYSWTPAAQNSPVATGLMAGTYSVTIADSRGCSVSATASLSDIPGGTGSVMVSSVSCNSGSNGTASVSVNGGTSPYTYLWTPSNGTGSTVTGLTAGTYSVIITDVNGCKDTAFGIVTQPQAVTATAAVVSSITCYQANNGAASSSATGGVTPYTFSWSTTPPQNTQNAINLGPFTYTITVTDGNGCTTKTNVTLTDPGKIVLNPAASMHVLCSGDSTGVANVSATGGTPAYTFIWGTVPPQTGSTATGLSTGIYSVSITDANGCKADSILVINEPPPLDLSTSGGTIICSGQPITLTASGSGGSGVYTFMWTPGFIQADSINVFPSSPTTYTVTVSDNNGCTGPSDTAYVNILPFNGSNVQALNPATVCPGDSTTISAVVSGFPGMFQYSWSHGMSGAGPHYVRPAQATTYIVTITNQCGSTVSDSVTINVKPPVSVSFSADTLAGCAPLCANFSSQANPAILSCNWSFGDGATDNTSCSPRHCYTQPGTYNVMLTVTDTAGCLTTVTDTGMITVYPFPDADFMAIPYTANIWNPVIQFRNYSTNDTLRRWDFGDSTTEWNTENPTHAYEKEGTYKVCLTVYSLYGCIDSICKDVIIKPDWSFFIPNAFTPNDDGINDKFGGKGFNILDYEMYILDRWGNEIFESRSIDLMWDGRANGGADPAQEDVYVYVITIKDLFGKMHKYIGHVTLVK